jgi:hypothetical protein
MVGDDGIFRPLQEVDYIDARGGGVYDTAPVFCFSGYRFLLLTLLHKNTKNHSNEQLQYIY